MLWEKNKCLNLISDVSFDILWIPAKFQWYVPLEKPEILIFDVFTHGFTDSCCLSREIEKLGYGKQRNNHLHIFILANGQKMISNILIFEAIGL